ncbi:hypothetical protein ACIBJF_32465 [Streptomyces sp. NPDC050743]|uniref:hypothetical protein n=1 Tax=Streptomyces sp. NPDC050743 TaxID=3365634 RepID=UPI0037B74C68
MQRATENRKLTMEHGIVRERLAVGGHGYVDPILSTYHPGGPSSTDRQLMSPHVRYGYLIKGELKLHLE